MPKNPDALIGKIPEVSTPMPEEGSAAESFLAGRPRKTPAVPKEQSPADLIKDLLKKKRQDRSVKVPEIKPTPGVGKDQKIPKRKTGNG